MKQLSIFVSAVMALGVVSCGMTERSAHRANKKASEADASVSKERLALVEQYKKCVKEADGDPQKLQECESYLKAAEALQ